MDTVGVFWKTRPSGYHEGLAGFFRAPFFTAHAISGASVEQPAKLATLGPRSAPGTL